ncbi:hypothetical protein [Mycobacteroides chelonae]|uniref:hypothetical protein n=1 Tax=Mycobacteroides chelonae TaxID=1774 RepID=UPI000F77A3FF|nr:hypothetical protein [Mycobacteroides chelonae]
MTSAPWFPEYYLEVSNSDPESYMSYSHLVRLSFRVKDKDLQGVIDTLMPNTPVETRNELLRGR